MLKKALGRAFAAAATAGLLVIPTAGTVAPQIANVACQYPDSVATNTDIDVDKPVMRQGEHNFAVVRVTSGAGTPRGTVTFRIETKRAVTKELENGRARFRIGGLKAGRTYEVTARFNGRCKWRNSSDNAFVTVKHPHHHHTHHGDRHGKTYNHPHSRHH